MSHNNLYFLINCPVCKHEELGVLMANNFLDIGDKIILTDVKFSNPDLHLLNEIAEKDKDYGGEVITPTTVLSNKGKKIENNQLVKGRVDEVLKVSCLDWLHTLYFIKAWKGVR